ncbi:dynein light chain Tctex-type protein 2B isoform X2 [Nematostella vectensis]|uniref:dynein light chain Tctex-type protein 2B isoform X2 n=1 Tax=Nematostella vectensis TaxID=45351 RepID=UPI002076E621|nr:dynein light chain Tctex-type protein 2B isoform X2 [Nematostella vectensis]
MSEDLANSYAIRPNFKNKFRPAAVKGLIHDTLNEELGGKTYDAEEAKSWPKLITDSVLSKIKDLELDRYKFVVQVTIGEQRGEGVNVACRCLWDSDTDNYAQDLLMTVLKPYLPQF